MKKIGETESVAVPSDWDTIEVGCVCRIESGCPFESAFFNEKEGVPLIRIRDVHSGRSETLYSGPYEEKYLVNNGDLLVGMDGEFRVRKWQAGMGLLNQRVCRLVPDEKQMDRDFVHFSIGIPLKKIEDYTPYTTVKHISTTQIREIVLPYPPLPEQRKIARVLGLVQRAMEQQERLLALTAELKEALMHQLFTAGLRGEPQKQTEYGPVPESWEVVPIRDCCTVQTGLAKGRKVDKKEALTLPYLRVANVQSGYLELSEIKTVTIRASEKERYLLQKGDIVLTEGGDFDKLGRGFIWKGAVEDCIHQNHIFAVRVNRTRLLPEFFAHLSQSPYGKAYFLSVAHKTTNLACINTTKLKGFPVLIPTKAEQEKIVQILESIDFKQANHARKRRLLEDLLRTLLHQLMTAQIRVHDLDLDILDCGDTSSHVTVRKSK